MRRARVCGYDTKEQQSRVQVDYELTNVNLYIEQSMQSKKLQITECRPSLPSYPLRLRTPFCIQLIIIINHPR